MMVTFVSECEKNALNKTRQVLDAFADRIGERTWQTRITQEGLAAVKKLLRKTASKNTAVACHWIRDRNRSELVWIVGNRNKFNAQGVVPVNTTRKDLMRTQWENDWNYLPLIKALSALAALFHDWGKSTRFFQKKLQENQIIADPMRHEWISALLLSAFVAGEDDETWLARLTRGEMDEQALIKSIAGNENPLSGLPVAAELIAWLILSHHKLPLPPEDSYVGWSLESPDELFRIVGPQWGYENNREESPQTLAQGATQCFEFPQGLPGRSTRWIKQAQKWANRMLDCLPLLEQTMADGSWRLVLQHARLSLMLADHGHSSQDADRHWRDELGLYANTDRSNGKLKQKLDEHLVGVEKQALRNAHLLPAVERELPRVYDVKILNKKSQDAAFRWQDKAVSRIHAWQQQSTEHGHGKPQGFFAVNMASTGCGKTFANAKVMRALSQDGRSLRYILALGLRTLTLQTGDEYRERIGLDDSEMAVLIGSKAVMELHRQNRDSRQESVSGNDEKSGAESLESLFEDIYIDYECAIPEDGLATVLTDERCRRFLYAPVLACTIDHLMAATETLKGGRYILPYLRMMSSDLVIDEVDDFDVKDLLAISRLVHLAGMLGRKVMISSATISPDLAEGFFNAYREGWRLFANSRGVSHNIGCAWIDEFATFVETIADGNAPSAEYHQFHGRFIQKRIKRLQDVAAKRKAEIVPCDFVGEQASPEQKDAIASAYFERIKGAIVALHQRHCTVDPRSSRMVSFGVVRMANIAPCVALTQYLAESGWPDDIDVRVMAYHSQQVLLLRSEQEKHLDDVLKRKKNVFDDPVVRGHLDGASVGHMIFILVATPVEEVGRDHDFDWAVAEPSSYRSIIQLVGRLLRHRSIFPDVPNIALMQYNLRALQAGNGRPAFCRPGYETADLLLNTHDLTLLVDEDALAQRVDAVPRIYRNKELNPENNLADLEHHVIACKLTGFKSRGPESMQGWLSQVWWLSGLPQKLNPFRAGSNQQKLFLAPYDDDFIFSEKDSRGREVPVERLYDIERCEMSSVLRAKLWLPRDYAQSLEHCAERQGLTMRQAALRYGEVSFLGSGKKLFYSDDLGLSVRH